MVKIDKKDLLILQALDKDSRASFSQIAKYCKLSKETVRYRYNRLILEKVLVGFWMVPKLDRSKFAYKVLLKTKAISEKSFEDFRKFIVDSKVVVWAATSNGYWNIHLNLISFKDYQISEFLKKILTTFSNLFLDIQINLKK